MLKYKLLTFLFILSFQLSAQWESKSSLPSSVNGRHHPVTFASDNFGYFLTGTSNQSNYTKDFYRYDPVDNSWTQLPDFPGVSRSFSIGVRHGQKGYVGFGRSTNDRLNDLWSYDFDTETWTQLETCPCQGRTHPAFLASEDGKLYVGLGGSDNGNLKDWWQYDIATDTWAQKKDFPAAPRHHPYQFSIGAYQYVGMGHGAGIYTSLHRYDSATDTWDVMESIPAEGRVAGTQFDNNGKGYVLSGDGDDHFYMDRGEFWEYDPVTNWWTELTSHPGRSRWAPGSFVINDIVYFTSGLDYDKNDLVDDVLSFPLPGVVSTNDLSLVTEGLVVSPNPARSFVNIELQNKSLSIQSLTVMSIDGREMLNFSNIDGSFYLLDIESLDAGVYVILVKTGKNLIAQKLSVVK